MPAQTHPLALLREAHDFSRERLAQRAGVSARTVFGIEREGVRPRRATAVVLAAALGCSPADLMGGTHDIPSDVADPTSGNGPGGNGTVAKTSDAGGGHDAG